MTKVELREHYIGQALPACISALAPMAPDYAIDGCDEFIGDVAKMAIDIADRVIKELGYDL